MLSRIGTTRSGVCAAVLAALVAGGCGAAEAAADGGDAEAGASAPAAEVAVSGTSPSPGENAASRPARAAASPGTLVLGDQTYAFTIQACDPAGSDPDGMTLRAAGTTPDGRRLAIEVERQAGPAGSRRVMEHSVFVIFGSIRDGDVWSARRIQRPDGEWRQGELGEEPADGPLVEVEGRRISVHGRLRREDGEVTAEASLTADCPTEAAPVQPPQPRTGTSTAIIEPSTAYLEGEWCFRRESGGGESGMISFAADGTNRTALVRIGDEYRFEAPRTLQQFRASYPSIVDVEQARFVGLLSRSHRVVFERAPCG